MAVALDPDPETAGVEESLPVALVFLARPDLGDDRHGLGGTDDDGYAIRGLLAFAAVQDRLAVGFELQRPRFVERGLHRTLRVALYPLRFESTTAQPPVDLSLATRSTVPA